MAATKPSSYNRGGIIATLFKPLAHEGILIEDEVILYCERKHWASLIRTSWETAAALFAITIIASGTTPENGLFVLVTFLSFVGLLYYVMREVREIRERGWRQPGFLIALLLVVIGFASGSIVGTAVFVLLLIGMRFSVQFSLWAFYHRRYITNRRVIASEGFLKSSISTMPLARVTDISLEKTWVAELLDYATLRVETAGQDQALSSITYLNKPDEFYETLIKMSTSEVDYERYFEV